MTEKPNLEDVKAYFLTFIKTEDIGLKNDEQAEWYPSNWHRTANNLALAAKALDTDTLFRVYVHKIRLGLNPCKEVKNHYDLFLNAYQHHLKWLEIDQAKKPWVISEYRFRPLFVFGFDYKIIINKADSYDDALQYTKAFNQLTKYINIPNLLAKPDKIYPFANDEKVINRAIAALDAVEFMRDGDFVMLHSGFQGAIFMLLLSPFAQAKACYLRFASTLNMADNHASHNKRVSDIMHRFESAAANFLKTI
jgi:hypothetical protein